MTERSRLSEELASLDDLMARMATMTSEAIGKALYAVRSQDRALVDIVKAEDSAIDRLQREIDDLSTAVLATQQPVASELRVFVSAFSVASNFERAADYAVHLAKATKVVAGEPSYRFMEKLEAMAQIDAEMVRGTAKAFAKRDPELARAVAAKDDIVDALHKSLLADILALMRERPEEADRAAKLLKTSAHLERLGDHMTNACEDILYMVGGLRADLNAR